MKDTRKNKPETKKVSVSVDTQKVRATLTKRKWLVVIPLVVILALLAWKYKGLVVAATVNGEPISRVSVVKELEKEGGKTVLGNLITNALIMQEAKKENVTVTQTEINDQLTQIETNLKSQGQDLNSALAAQGMTKDDLINQIKLQALVQKMAAKNVTVTDAEAQDYFKKNQSTYPKGTKYESVSAQIKSDLQQQKTSEAINTWVTSLRTKAKINYFVSY